MMKSLLAILVAITLSGSGYAVTRAVSADGASKPVAGAPLPPAPSAVPTTAPKAKKAAKPAAPKASHSSAPAKPKSGKPSPLNLKPKKGQTRPTLQIKPITSGPDHAVCVAGIADGQNLGLNGNDPISASTKAAMSKKSADLRTQASHASSSSIKKALLTLADAIDKLAASTPGNARSSAYLTVVGANGALDQACRS